MKRRRRTGVSISVFCRTIWRAGLPLAPASHTLTEFSIRASRTAIALANKPIAKLVCRMEDDVARAVFQRPRPNTLF